MKIKTKRGEPKNHARFILTDCKSADRKLRKQKELLDPNVFGKKVGIIGTIFGCRHKHLSRPISNGQTAYRTCVECGSRKPFDPETFESMDGFYKPPIVKEIEC